MEEKLLCRLLLNTIVQHQIDFYSEGALCRARHGLSCDRTWRSGSRRSIAESNELGGCVRRHPKPPGLCNGSQADNEEILLSRYTSIKGIDDDNCGDTRYSQVSRDLGTKEYLDALPRSDMNGGVLFNLNSENRPLAIPRQLEFYPTDPHRRCGVEVSVCASSLLHDHQEQH